MSGAMNGPDDVAKFYSALIWAAADKYRLAPNLIAAHIWHESKGDPNAVGDGGEALGLMQMHEPAATEMGVDWHSLRDPAIAIDAGVGYLAKQLKNFGGDLDWALAAYNQGPGVIGRAWRYAQAVQAART